MGEEIKKDFDTAREEGEQAAESQQYEENENNEGYIRRKLVTKYNTYFRHW